ncbi:MAG: hypothetical protein JWN40_2853 [Phycisphaerales bacterium]|nr:hypothetical protein [Phycisphaerales bacterium]
MRWTLTCVWMIAALSVVAEEWPVDPLSRTAIARNQETFARLKPCALQMTWKRGDSEPATAILKYKGTWVFADWERPQRTGVPRPPLGSRIRAVLNDAYFVFAPGDSSPLAYQYESDGGSKSTATIANWTSTHLPPNPLMFSFGIGRQTLPEAMEVYRQAYACVAEVVIDDAGRNVVRMTIYPKTDSGPSDARWVFDFDPARGYAITRVASGSQPNFFVETQVELQAGEYPSAWLPRHISRRVYAHDEPRPSDSEDFDIRILPDADLSDAAFRATALDLRPNQMLARMPPNGAPGSSVFLIDGVWVRDLFLGRPGQTPGTAPKVAAVGPQWPAILAAAVFVAAVTIVLALKRAQRRQ